MSISMNQHVETLKKSTHVIDETFRQVLKKNVIDGVGDFFFGTSKDPRMTKIIQNVELMTLGLIGMEIHRDDMVPLYEQYLTKFVESVVARGAAVGVEAGQSLVQDIVQSILKSQHGSGKRGQITGANPVEKLNKLRTNINVVRAHLKHGGIFVQPDGTKIVIDHRYLSDRYEQIRMHDVLVSCMGNSKVQVEKFNPNIYQRKDVVFINIKAGEKHRPKQPVFQFQVDPDKLADAGITMIHVIQTLLLIDDVTFVVYPLSTFRFDMINVDVSKISDTTVLAKLEKTPIKGINGLVHISTKNIEPQDLIKLQRLPNGKTRAFFDMYCYTQVPLDVIRNMIVTKESANAYEKLKKVVSDIERKLETQPNDTRLKEELSQAYDEMDSFKYTNAKPVIENLDLEDVDSLFYFEFDGEVTLSKQPYTYYLFHGDITMGTIIEHLGKYLNLDYLVTNDPREMVKKFGTTIAVTQHELLYSEELEASGTAMLYQHISLICAYMFGFNLNPISPSGYLKNKGVTALDRFAFEQYSENLGVEAVKGAISNTKSITTSIFTGNKANIGTAYIKFRINQKQRKEVMESYRIAYEEQLYEGKHQGIELPLFDKIVMRTDLQSGVGKLVNNVNPFE